MVEMLLLAGCGPNESIQMYSGRTVWDLYLAFLSENRIADGRHRETTWIPIRHSAKPLKAWVVDKQQEQRRLSMKDILSKRLANERLRMYASVF
jgi:hypothetical protein